MSFQAPTPHSTVTCCTHTLGSHALRPPSCPICLDPISRTSPTITHTPCLNAFHTHCFDALVLSSTNLLLPKPSPTKCPIYRGLMPLHPVLTYSPSLPATTAVAQRPNLPPPHVDHARIRPATAALTSQKAHAARQAQLARQKAQRAAQQRLPSRDRSRSLIPARGILLGELMGRLATPGMLPAVKAALQRRVLTAGRLEAGTGRLMPRY